MARRLRLLVLSIVLVAAGVLPCSRQAALAADLDERGEARANRAMNLYRRGLFEEAAQIFAELSVNYPNMLIFTRDVGACFYHLNRPEAALYNLRLYLERKKDIAPDDKAVVDRWIVEMEKLQDQRSAELLVQSPAPAPVANPGLDLSSRSPAPPVHTPFHKTWWFWTGVGAAVVAGTVTAVLLSGSRSEPHSVVTGLGTQRVFQ